MTEIVDLNQRSVDIVRGLARELLDLSVKHYSPNPQDQAPGTRLGLEKHHIMYEKGMAVARLLERN